MAFCRDKQKRSYFPGGDPDTGGCACGKDGTCDLNAEGQPYGVLCNCDINDESWRNDSGYITIKRDMPLTVFQAGDTGKVFPFEILGKAK